ncbi:MAG: hypothetical protein U9N78_06795 [Actinomycetota bacterium]|nr:hypothetical protein [Actinomycetota bacterium]
MRMRQQLIIAVAVVFATVAVGVNVYAATRSAEQHAQQLERVMPVASVLDRGVFDTAATGEPSDDTPPPDRSDVPGDPCVHSDACYGNSGSAPGSTFSNHGRAVSAFAMHIGFTVGEDGPPGALVRAKARPDVRADGPPRSDRAEERSSSKDNAPPGQTKDKDKDKDG